MTVRALAFLLLPLMVSGHGVAMHTANTPEEVDLASGHALDFVQQIHQQCMQEVPACAEKKDVHSVAKCFMDHHDDLSWDCQMQVVNMARHMPHAKRAYDKMKGIVSLSDFGKKTVKGCNYSSDATPYVWSYHIHFMWNELTDNKTGPAASPNRGNMSQDLHEKFIKEFAPDIKFCRPFSFLTDLWNKRSVTGPEDHEFAEPCMFPSLTPGGPFFLWERGYHISPTMFHKVVPWLMANRPVHQVPGDIFGRDEPKHQDAPIGILIHPNTGCQYNDLNHYSMWAGPSKPLFYDILEGCVWAACEDEVLGCIAFNHLGKNEGYGTCYQAPKAMNHQCTYSIEPTSNTSTMDCKKEYSALV
jgi:hypothetical protein